MLTRLATLTAAAAACAAFALPTLPAQASPDLEELVQVEVLDGGMTRQGTYQAALRLTLAPGWKTYWRAPGDAGIPPQFNWRGSRNVDGVAMVWPQPEVFLTSGMRTIGYEHELVLPVEVTPSADGQVRLKGQIDLGLCSDVCIPGRVTFDHALDPQAGRHPSIAAALAQRPYSATEAGVQAATCHLSPSKHGMRIEARIAMPPVGGAELAVIEPGDPSLWAAQAQTRREGGTLIASSELLHESGGTFALDRSKIRITVLGNTHAVDIRGCTAG